MHPIYVGPAGWSYKDWEGAVYPPHGSRFDPLAYLAGFFDTIEVNSSFYRTPPPAHARSWVRRITANSRFRFTVKLNRIFTHERNGVDAPQVLAFRHFLEPLLEEQRLGAVLIQFPWSARNTDEIRQHMTRLFEALEGIPLAVEVRHGSFQNPEFFRMLDETGAGFVNIDQPLFGDSITPSAVGTGRVGYVRLHGRNSAKWFAPNTQTWERYDYLYSPKELAPWVERIREVASERETYVVTNNHFRGQAIVNALDLKKGLGMPIEVPPQVRLTYPERF